MIFLKSFAGTTPSLYSFFAPNPPGWNFRTERGQKVSPLGGAFGQGVGVGHVRSTDTSLLDLVVLSHTVPIGAKESLTLVR